ncbi:hypothetical protein T03_13350 [Trichinella britovi]|uniref:Uncharacterized protein n=1 Tax=Trichinella britovi TaxID=45882 RepID=A0A0V1C5M5_TRIBR|nr:hypothetical protein T03_13350 [Trichinella britovi]
MTTRRRDRASEDEPAKSDNGRTGADPEEANQTTPPSGSVHRKQKKRAEFCKLRQELYRKPYLIVIIEPFPIFFGATSREPRKT